MTVTSTTSRLHRYPRTRHVEGSAVQPGDEDLDLVPAAAFVGSGMQVVVSEKIDGANAAVSFAADGELLLQSRSRYLDEHNHTTAPYAGFREWAERYEDALWPVLGDRYVMFGEWVLAKQTVFYDALPDAFLELDVLDKSTQRFLSTPRRRLLLRGAGLPGRAAVPIVSAPVLAQGKFASLDEITRHLGPSRFKTPVWRHELVAAIHRAQLDGAADVERFVRETDPSDEMEGLVLKAERDGVVVDRAKFVRASFCSPYMHTSSQWLAARRVHNRVAA